MFRNIVTAAKIYLVASNMDVNLTVKTMQLAYPTTHPEDILDAVKSAQEQLPEIATKPDQLSKSAWIKLIRYHNNADMARASMMMRHPCNTVEQIEGALMAAWRRLHDGDSRERKPVSSRRDFDPDRTPDHNLLDIGPPWSGLDEVYRTNKKTADAFVPYSNIGYQFARLCDVREKNNNMSDGHHISDHEYPGNRVNNKNGKDVRRDILESAKIQLVRSDDVEHAKNELGQFYPEMSGNIDSVIEEARQSLRAEANSISMTELTNFAWIQLVCELFGRRSIRDLLADEYPYTDENRVNYAIKEARDQLLRDIVDAGPWILKPAVAYQIILASGNYRVAIELAKHKWRYLGSDLIRYAFKLSCSPHKKLECRQCTVS